jgi:ElaB/YqjD/DUF883 family membrane-anchored ribosome-binding protein
LSDTPLAYLLGRARRKAGHWFLPACKMQSRKCETAEQSTGGLLMAAPQHIGRSVSVEQALSILEDAAIESADDIKKLISSDYRKLKRALNFGANSGGGFTERLTGLKDVSLEAITQAKERVKEASGETVRVVDRSAHQNPWAFIGGASAAGGIIGFILGRKMGAASKSKWGDVSG